MDLHPWDRRSTSLSPAWDEQSVSPGLFPLGHSLAESGRLSWLSPGFCVRVWLHKTKHSTEIYPWNRHNQLAPGTWCNHHVQTTSEWRDIMKNIARPISWIWCNISFSLIRLAVMCLRGARFSLHYPARSTEEPPLDLTIQEGCIPTLWATPGHWTLLSYTNFTFLSSPFIFLITLFCTLFIFSDSSLLAPQGQTVHRVVSPWTSTKGVATSCYRNLNWNLKILN